MRRKFSSTLKNSKKISKYKKKKTNFKFYFFIFVFIAFVVGVIFCLRISSLQIKKVSIKSDNQTTTENIKKFIEKGMNGYYALFIPRTSIFFVDEKEIEKEIKENFPRIKEVDAKKDINGVLQVELKEKITSAIWCSSTDICKLVDESGELFSVAEKADLEDKVIFEGILEDDQRIENFWRFIEFTELLAKQDIHTKKYVIEIDKKYTAETNIGDIVFSFDDISVKSKIENILLIIEDEKKHKEKVEFEYIDLRFGNKVFYKLK